jgi:hypothetical protein
MAEKPFHLIIFEHSDETVWGETENVHKVVEWRGKDKKIDTRRVLCRKAELLY